MTRLVGRRQLRTRRTSFFSVDTPFGSTHGSCSRMRKQAFITPSFTNANDQENALLRLGRTKMLFVLSKQSTIVQLRTVFESRDDTKKSTGSLVCGLVVEESLVRAISTRLFSCQMLRVGGSAKFYGLRCERNCVH